MDIINLKKIDEFVTFHRIVNNSICSTGHFDAMVMTAIAGDKFLYPKLNKIVPYNLFSHYSPDLENPLLESELNTTENTKESISVINPGSKKRHKARCRRNGRNKLFQSKVRGWHFYCRVVTIFIPSKVLKFCGIRTVEQQRAWREKVGLISIILAIGAIVIYISFIFTNTACAYKQPKILHRNVSDSFIRINGRAYPFNWANIPESTPILISYYGLFAPKSYGGKDASLLFQNVNGNCHGIIKPRENCTIPHDNNGNLAWYFPCVVLSKDDYMSWDPEIEIENKPSNCHISEFERDSYYYLEYPVNIYYTWDDIKNSNRSLVVYNNYVLDLKILQMLYKYDLDVPPKLLELGSLPINGYDISITLTTNYDKKLARCLIDIATVGLIDAEPLGCIVANIILYLFLIFIMSIVILKFVIACYFRWVVAKAQGSFKVNNKTMIRIMRDIEDWAEDINKKAPIMNVNFLPENTSLITRKRDIVEGISLHPKRMSNPTSILSGPNSSNVKSATYLKPNLKIGNSISQNFDSFIRKGENYCLCSFPETSNYRDSLLKSLNDGNLDPSIIHKNVVKPNNIIHGSSDGFLNTICFVTCYSEGVRELRSTLDALCTTTYPNTHKLIILVCDGQVTGAHNKKLTSEIALNMITDFIEDPNEVIPYSYLSIASGAKRFNMAKVYGGYYKYDSDTVEESQQQQVPIVLVSKCGSFYEIHSSPKPGNRGKRDSQIILMSLLQRAICNERMSELEFQLLKVIWQVGGKMIMEYETVLMVDADTRVFPDSIRHMCAEMAKDTNIMGLCGETKIANKKESWVTAIQVFEYYISHHHSKAFESIFGSVLCLPGCFSMFRIKSPKDKEQTCWVPILANPDIVECYSNNSTDTLHQKNLLLLGEDRYLSSLLLRKFPNRKQVFVPKAACKTVVPSKFLVLLSQRRRWINSTIHNLVDLLRHDNLCGTFCFSMQFVVLLELLGTILLPFAILSTIYVIIYSALFAPLPMLTLVLLLVILGLPGVFIVITTTKLIYVVWMLVYLVALPIWNLILPVYAFWKFDDFSWGETRATKDGKRNDINETADTFNHTAVNMMIWKEHALDEKARGSRYPFAV